MNFLSYIYGYSHCPVCDAQLSPVVFMEIGRIAVCLPCSQKTAVVSKYATEENLPPFTQYSADVSLHWIQQNRQQEREISEMEPGEVYVKHVPEKKAAGGRR